MQPKQMLTDGTFCPMPWTGLMYNFDGSVKNCIRSAGTIGNIKDRPIKDILLGDKNLETQTRMQASQPGQDCYPCYDLERGKRSFDIVSDRIFYMRELKSVPLSTYSPGKHELHTIDVRWSNLCNFACVYCGPDFSSRWASELNISQNKPSIQQLNDFKKYILSHADQLRHVYMAGGEPLLIKENQELLEILKKQNPDINLRINTNLSKVDTKIFEMICSFKNVHWTVSAETQDREFEYIRYGGQWKDFLDNLEIIQNLEHKISFNMLHFLLNYRSLFDCIDYLMHDWKFHPNSFIVGSLLAPDYLNIRHLPNAVLKSLKDELQNRINQKPGHLLEDSYQNLLHHIQQPFDKNLPRSLARLRLLDQQRNLDSREIFPELYSLANDKSF
jgi:organic radical activating enzyme